MTGEWSMGETSLPAIKSYCWRRSSNTSSIDEEGNSDRPHKLPPEYNTNGA